MAICPTAVARCQTPIVRGRYTGVILRLLEIELLSHSAEAGCRCKLGGHTDCAVTNLRLFPAKYDVRDAGLLNADE